MKKEASLFNHLIQPIRIGSITIRNRMVQPGMGTNLAAADGTASDAIVDYYARRAQGGVGLIITEVCCPEPRGRVIPGELEISSLAFLPSLSRLANAAHAGGAKIALQLAHGGCFASQSVTGHQPISPSGVGTMLLPGDTPRAMTVEEIHELVEMYGQAALRARMAGFDAVEIHGAHGYMPLQFLSGYTNRRTDEYGGSFENRARFALEVIAAIKRLAGPDFTVIYRLSAEEDAPGGVTLEEAVAFARLAEQAGVDALNISAGTWDSRMHDFFAVTGGQASADGKRLGQGVSIGMWVPPHYVPRGNLVELAATVKKAVKVPVIAVCGLTPLMAEEVIAKGKADLTAMGRQILADPDYPAKILARKPELVRPCVRCNECLGSVLGYRGLDCAVNAEAGKEHETFCGIQPAAQSQKVMVVGGGPAGMEAARVARLRGHDVTLFEKDKELGGLLRWASIPASKADYRDLLQWQKNELVRLGVKVELGTTITAQMITRFQPDALIIATGSHAAKPNLSGIDKKGIQWALDVLGGKIPAGKNIIVCGGGLVGVETALFLAAEHGKQVTLVEQRGTLAPEVEIFTQWVIQGRLAEAGVAVKLNHCIECVTPTSVRCNCESGVDALEADAVVMALGMEADDTLFNPLPGKTVRIGDAVQARNVLHAVHEGYHAGRRI